MPDSAEETPDRLPERAVNGRPSEVADFFFEGTPYQNWQARNWGKRRFFVLNLQHVIEDMHVRHTNTGPNFAEATRIISVETSWNSQYRADYTCAKVQIYPDQRVQAKHFEKAVVMIVAMEVHARSNNFDLNVYDFLRIIPAFYFVDRLNAPRLKALGDHYSTLSEDEISRQFGSKEDPAAGKRSFEDQCLFALRQVEGSRLLHEMAAGYCVTEYVASRLVQFIEKNFPPELHVGPVRVAGDHQAREPDLGSDDAAPSLRVPRYREPSEISPPYLG